MKKKKVKSKMGHCRNSNVCSFMAERSKKRIVSNFSNEFHYVCDQESPMMFCFNSMVLDINKDEILIYVKIFDESCLEFSDDGAMIGLFLSNNGSMSLARELAKEYKVTLDEDRCEIVLLSPIDFIGEKYFLFLNALIAFGHYFKK